MHRTLKIVVAATAGAAVLTGAAACGSNSSSTTTAAATSAAPATTATTATTATMASTPTTASAPATTMPEKEGPVIKVAMGAPKEFSFALSAPTVKAGHVTFTATNKGSMTHELVVLKTPMPANKLPMESAVKAKEIGHVGEIPDLPAGATKSVTLTLKPGHYTVLCNLPGHYKGGMFANLTVK